MSDDTEPTGAVALTPGMRDNSAIFPALPAKEPDDAGAWMAKDQGIWQTCWQYVLTHDLTASEGAAFWTAANLVHKAMKAEREAGR